MENVLASELQQSVSAYKQIKNPKKISRSFVSQTCENMHVQRGVQRGLLLAPPARSLSYSCTPSLALHNYNNIQHVQQHYQQTSSPPLLPLPVTKPRHSSLPSPSRKPYRARDQSLTPKKSKQPTRREEANTKPVEKKIAKLQQTVLSESLMVDATLNPLGPDPNDLPKDVSKVFCADFVAVKNKYQDFEKFSGSMFTISPPPSSLPLPKFSLRRKQLISCNAEAAASGIDAGATDNLQRLLRLR